MKRLLLLLVLLALLSCQSAADQVATPIANFATESNPTVAITSTLIPTSTLAIVADTPTSEPTVQPTVTATQQATTETPATATATQPAPTRLPTLTATTAVPSPSATPVPNGVPTVKFFRFAAPLIKPSQPVLLEWDVQGVETVTISRNGGKWAEAGQQWTVANRETMEHTFPISVGGWTVTYVLTSSDAPSLRSEFTVTVPCEYEWAFRFDYSGDGCPVEPIISTAAFQPFEDGFMLWTSELDLILYSTWDGSIHDELVDSFNDASDPVRLASIDVPDGYLQPEYGFGKLWRNNDFVRQTLGWAVEQPVNFTTIRQSEAETRSGNFESLIGLPNDALITLTDGNPIWTISYPKPTVPRAEQRPPATITAAPPTNAITVNYFRFATQPVTPSGGAMLEWDVDGVDTIEIIRSGGEWNEAQATYALSADGTLPQSFAPELGGWPIFYVMKACNETACVEEAFSAELPCEYPVLIEAAANSLRCLSAGIRSRGFQQNFERGLMIWIEAEDVIIYTTWNGLTHAELVDTFEHGVDPVKDETLIPPDGLYQPEYGLGKVWRNEAGVRELLGWATDWGSEYTVNHQSQPPHRYGFQEWITLKNGGLITISHPDPIWKIE